jgi:hypothetical protein
MSDSPLERLWKEYGGEFSKLDDLSLARWMAQTLGQLQGSAWRLSHPLMGLYRLLGQLGHERGIWLKRLANAPGAYSEAPCCRAPLLPLFTRDILESGLICQHCSETAVPFDELPGELQVAIRPWAEAYTTVHEVAHWDDAQRGRCPAYDEEFERAAKQAETLLVQARTKLIPQLLDQFPAIVWEDHDECLEVRPEDLEI